MRERSRARGWALQALYAWEIRGGEPDAALRVLDEIGEDMRISAENRFFAEVLLRIVGREITRIDKLVQEQLANWRLERLTAIDRNILRLGAAELLFVDDVDPRATVRELVWVAERYGTPESPRFVNGVLDAIARRAVPEKGSGGG